MRKWAPWGAGLILLGATVFFFFVFRPYSPNGSIPQGWGYSRMPAFRGAVASPQPLSRHLIPQHPFLAGTNASNMHVDGFASDVHPSGGPLGHQPDVTSYAHGPLGGECASVTFDSNGYIVAVCATFKNFSLLLIDPDSLRPLAEMLLPPRPSSKTFNLRKIMTDTSGGAYFYLDHRDRAVLVNAHQNLLIIGQDWSGGQPRFVVEREIDLSSLLLEETSETDAITAVLPDWSGTIWFVSREGLIGTVDPNTAQAHVLQLPGEQVQNSFAIDESAAYIVSDHALYAVALDATTGEPRIAWREQYERAKENKLGSIDPGSGTTPTLLGDGLVAIADDASPRSHVLIYRRAVDLGEGRDRLVCKIPVFEPGRSTTENTLIGYNNSVIIENNFGYDLFPTMMFGRIGAGGVTRIDVSEDHANCETVWRSSLISQTTVPKLSAETGLVYLYSKDADAPWGVDAFYLSAVDFETGQTVFQALAGTGVSYDNNWAPITIGPDRCAYVGVLRGLVRICDAQEDE